MQNQKTPPIKTHQEQSNFCHSNVESIFKSYLDMPVWQLRHLQVSRQIEKHSIKHVLDIGCAEGTLINRLSRSNEIEQLIGIDMSGQVLEKAKYNVYPELMQENLAFMRKRPLQVELYQLNVLEDLPLQKFRKIELVTLIQFIEHIKENQLPILCRKVFSQIKPKFVIITTPNQEFNVYFNFKEGQMRHPEHLFEWNRDRFIQFCDSLSKQYEYDYEIFGIGEHITDTQHGSCSQGAHFIRRVSVDINQCAQPSQNKEPSYEIRYPFWCDRLQSRIENELRHLVTKHNYSSSSQITEYFKESKIGRKIIQEKEERENNKNLENTLDDKGNVVQLPLISKQWVVEQIKNIKYCGYNEDRDELFYEYESSSVEDEEEYFLQANFGTPQNQASNSEEIESLF